MNVFSREKKKKHHHSFLDHILALTFSNCFRLMNLKTDIIPSTGISWRSK